MFDLSPTSVTDSYDRLPVPLSDTHALSLRDLSDEQEQILIARARSGEQAARDEMLLWVLPVVKRFAVRYFLAFAWEAPGRVPPDDLVSEATVRMLEQFEVYGGLESRWLTYSASPMRRCDGPWRANAAPFTPPTRRGSNLF